MNAFAAVRNALQEISWPKVPYRYDGTENKYIVYNYADNHGADFGDDEPGADLAEIQVHLYMPVADPVTHAKTNYMPDMRNVRELLFLGGFPYPAVNVIREDETNYWHIVFECEYEETKEP